MALIVLVARLPLWVIMYGVDALTPRVVTIGFVVLAAFGAVAGISALAHRLWHVMRGNTAIATVVDIEVSSGPQRRTQYIPVVEFVTQDGQRRTCVSLKDALSRKPRIGQRVRIIYSPRNPRWAIMPMWFLTVGGILGPILMIMFIVAVFGL
jgi:hypothetical protein